MHGIGQSIIPQHYLLTSTLCIWNIIFNLTEMSKQETTALIMGAMTGESCRVPTS